MGDERAPDLLLWVGSSFYPTIDDYVREAMNMGCAKRIARLPEDIVPGLYTIVKTPDGRLGIFVSDWYCGGDRSHESYEEVVFEDLSEWHFPENLDDVVAVYMDERERQWLNCPLELWEVPLVSEWEVPLTSERHLHNTLEAKVRALLRGLELDRASYGKQESPPENLPARVVTGATPGGEVNFYIQGLGGPPWKRVKAWVIIQVPTYSWTTREFRRLSPDEEAQVVQALRPGWKAAWASPRVLWDEKGAQPGATTFEWEVDMVANFNLDWRARGPDGREGTVLAEVYRGSGSTDVVLLMRGQEPSTLLSVAYPADQVVATRRNSHLTDEEKELKGLSQMASRQAFLKTLPENARKQMLKNGDYWGAWKLLEEGQEVKLVHEKYERKEVKEMPEWDTVEAKTNLELLKGNIQQAVDLTRQVLTRPGIPPAVARHLETVASDLGNASQFVSIAYLALAQRVVEQQPHPEARPAATAQAEEAPAGAGVVSEATPVARGPSVKTGEFDYFLADGRGPYPTVQDALDAMGVDREKRPKHNRWERLSATWKVTIIRRSRG